MSSMKTICSWCLAYISGDLNSDDYSHGICPKCYRKVNLEAKYGKLPLQDILALIDEKFSEQQKLLYESFRASSKVREAFFKVLETENMDLEGQG